MPTMVAQWAFQAQWKVVAQSFSITEKTNGKRLCNALRRLAVAAGEVIKKQIVDLEAQIAKTEEKIDKTEGEMNSFLYQLYDLTEEEGDRRTAALRSKLGPQVRPPAEPESALGQTLPSQSPVAEVRSRR